MLTDRIVNTPTRVRQRRAASVGFELPRREPNLGRGVRDITIGLISPEIAMAVFVIGGPVWGPVLAAPVIAVGAFGFVSGTADITFALTRDLIRSMHALGLYSASPRDFEQLAQINGLSDSLLWTVSGITLQAFGYHSEGFTDRVEQDSVSGWEASVATDWGERFQPLVSEMDTFSRQISSSKLSEPARMQRDPFDGWRGGELKEPREVDPWTDDRGWMEA